RCRDCCKSRSRASEQAADAVAAVLPGRLTRRVNGRIGYFLVVLASLSAMLAAVLGIVYYQETLASGTIALRMPFVKAYALLVLVAAVCSWWIMLAGESRRMAEDESTRQTQLLTR